MPELPKLLADWFTAPFRRPVSVSHLELLAKDLLRVKVTGQSLVGVACRPGQEVEFRVSDTSFRHYTPSSFDSERGEMEIVFFLHDKGPGSAWARALKIGDSIDVLGPGGKFSLAKAGKHVLLGDETVLGLCEHFERESGASLCGAIELDAHRLDWPQVVGLRRIEAVERLSKRGLALCDWAVKHLGEQGNSETHYYLVGHAQSIVDVRKALVAAGCKKKQIHAKAYWADGKRGL